MTEEKRKVINMTYPEMVNALLSKCDSPEADLVHIALGVVGEVLEYESAPNYNKLTLELGDIFFYIQAGYEFLRRRAPNISPPTEVGQCLIQDYAFDNLQWLLHSNSKFLIDLTKKPFAYHHAIDYEQLLAVFVNFDSALTNLCHMHGSAPADIKQRNQVKLDARYPDGVFTSHHAAQRLDGDPVEQAPDIGTLIEEVSAGVKRPRESQLIEGFAALSSDDIFEPFLVLAETYPEHPAFLDKRCDSDEVFRDCVERVYNSNSVGEVDDGNILLGHINELYSFMARQRKVIGGEGRGA